MGKKKSLQLLTPKPVEAAWDRFHLKHAHTKSVAFLLMRNKIHHFCLPPLTLLSSSSCSPAGSFSPLFLSTTPPQLPSLSVSPLLSLPSSLDSFLGPLSIFQQSHPGSLKHSHHSWHHPGSISAQEEEPTTFSSKQSLTCSFHINMC